jgi:hypothetical protein
MFGGRAAIRLVVGFLLGLAFWLLFSSSYERLVASAAESVLRLAETPAVTRIEAPGGTFIISRSDFPPSSRLPEQPASTIHFNFVLIAALFALDPHPLRGDRVGRFLLAAAALFGVHVTALIFRVQSVYALDLGAWSPAHYGALARNFWAGGFHFYQIAGGFAAPFAFWWLFGRVEPEAKPETPRRGKKKKTA